MTGNSNELFLTTFCNENYNDLKKYSIRFGKDTAEDLVHEAILKLRSMLEKGKTIINPLPYVKAMIRNIYIDQKREQTREKEALSILRYTTVMQLKINADSNPYEETVKEMENLSSSIALDRGIEQLDKEDEKKVARSIRKGKKRREIAKELGITTKDVKEIRQRAIKHLKNELIKRAEHRKNGTS